MLFNSIHFLVFLPLVLGLHFALPGQRGRKILLLAASYYFYAVWSVPLTSLLLLSTAVDYTAARTIEGAASRAVKRAALLASLGTNLGILFFFKYSDFFSESLYALTGERWWPLLGLVLPMGISFYTFQTMAYTIDVYRGKTHARTNPIDVALYVAFFPQLVAGPIQRADELMPQFEERSGWDGDRVLSGFLLVLWGLGKKVFVADPMGAIVTAAYGDPVSYSGTALLLATYAFALQIYLDFSAYTDIARGAARTLGYELMENFRMPYLATSIRDFWRRWHISLSTWLRDYLYISLGGSRKGRWKTYRNLALTMLLGGLWHGAAWTFVVWGALHGLYLVVERLTGTEESGGGWVAVARGFLTFHLVCLSWVFFRATSFGDAFEILRRIATAAPGEAVTAAPLWVLAAMLAAQAWRRRRELGVEDVVQVRPLARWAAYVGAVLVAIAVAGSQNTEFIYFQF